MKLNDTKIKYMIRKMGQGLSIRQVGEELRISHERVRQINNLYLTTEKIPVLKQQGRPRK